MKEEREGEEKEDEEKGLYLFPLTLSAPSQDNSVNTVDSSPCCGVSTVLTHGNAFIDPLASV